jgi:hypothetical protein
LRQDDAVKREIKDHKRHRQTQHIAIESPAEQKPESEAEQAEQQRGHELLGEEVCSAFAQVIDGQPA